MKLWLVCCVALVVSACTAAAPAAPAAPTGAATTAAANTPAALDPKRTTLTIGVSSEVQTFDPQVNTALISAYRFYPNIYETLIQTAPDGTVKPMLADSWTESQDGLIYTFKLHPNVKFSDGTPFNAAAVKAAIDRFNTLGKGATFLFNTVDTIDVVDDQTIAFHLKERYGPFLSILAAWQSAIFVSPTAIQQHDGGDNGQTWLRDHTAGTGPFMLDSWTPNSRIVFVRNPNYRDPPAADAIKTAIYTFVPEPGTLRQQLEAGDIDIDEAVTPALLAPLGQAAGVRVSTDPSSGSSFGQWIAFNLTKEPFNNADFRRAVAYAIDYKRLVTVWNGIAEQAQGPFPSSFMPWFSATDALQYQQDLTKAADYLHKANMSSPISPPMKITLTWQVGFTGQRDMAQLIKEDLAKIGIDLQIVQLELPQWRQGLWDHTFEMTYFQESLRYTDPDAFASFQFDSREWRSGGTNPGVRDPSIDELIRSAGASDDQEARRLKYNQLQKFATEESPYLYLVNTKVAWAAGTDVTGIQWNPYYGQFWNVNQIKKTGKR
jgi:peptide/nickel transport system substrate-binding protein